MPLAPGNRIGAYEVVAALGAGGMGEVYRAAIMAQMNAPALVAALILSSCAAPRRAGVTLRFQPDDEVIYKLEDDLGHESWDFALVVRGPAPGLDRARIEHRAGGAVRHSVDLDAAAVSAYTAPGGAGEVVLHPAAWRLPAALEIDSVEVTLFAAGRVVGRHRARLEGYAQKGRYRLPVTGCWFVSSGHDWGVEHRRFTNHAHFAWDLVRVDAGGDPSSGERLEDHRAYGQPVLAPAAGSVVDVRGDHADRPPGSPGGRDQANFVVVDHGGGERSRLAHLRQGSVTVRAGDRVTAGQRVGAVGNSGMTEAPHLHVAFERLAGDERRPLPIRFSDYRVTWNQGARVPVELGRPRRGQFFCAE